jgi:hypothetical protein
MSAKKITIKAGNPAVFNPNPLTAQANYNVFWYNSDQSNAHWPAPSAADKTAWFDYQIQPGAQSNQLALPPMSPPAAYTLNYVCALHPNEKGQIKVTLGKKKGAFAKKTKKSAFAKKTKLSAFAKTTKKSAFGKNTK